MSTSWNRSVHHLQISLVEMRLRRLSNWCEWTPRSTSRWPTWSMSKWNSWRHSFAILQRLMAVIISYLMLIAIGNMLISKFAFPFEKYIGSCRKVQSLKRLLAVATTEFYTSVIAKFKVTNIWQLLIIELSPKPPKLGTSKLPLQVTDNSNSNRAKLCSVGRCVVIGVLLIATTFHPPTQT